LALAIFLVISPYVVLDSRAFHADLAWIAIKTAGAGRPGLLDGLMAFANQCLNPALGTPLIVAAELGVVVALVRRTRADVVLLSFVAAYALLAARAGVLNDRYAIPVIVPALLFAARAAAAALGALRLGETRAAWGTAFVITALSAPLAL